MTTHLLRPTRRTMLELTATTVALASAAAVWPATASAAGAHSRWDRILKAAVSPAGWVDYELIRTRFSGELKSYLEELARSSEGSSTAAAKALWINAYNAICVQTLIDHDLPSSVPHAKLFGKNIFTDKRYAVAGKVRTLDEIEHDILRKKYPDNRVHAAVVCGASSCPRLRTEAYVADRLDAQLVDECRSWIQKEKTKAGKRKNVLDRDKGVLYVSKIFDWYEKDFGGDKKGIRSFVARYSDTSQRKFLETQPVSVEFLPYDWGINKRD